MPLVPAHPAAVLPLQRLGLPLSALVAGSMSPDAAMFSAGRGYDVTHSVLGVVTVDVAIALLGLTIWFGLLRDPLADLTPYVRDRVPARARPGRNAWLLAPVTAAVGAATHVFWDSGTHEGEWLVNRVSFLRQDLGPLPGYEWAQSLSTVIGTSIVLAYVLACLRRRAVRPRPSVVSRPVLWLTSPPLVGLLVGLVMTTRAAEWEEPAAYVVAGTLQGTALAVLVVAVAWRRLSRTELAR